jgi:hypothetical protein
MTGRRLSPAVFLLAAAVTLAPWIAWLATSLPCHYQSRHWGIAWAGFDAGLALGLGLTGFAALRRAAWLDRAAVATATLLVADAWFDIVTSRGAGAVTVAVAEALALELPIAAFCLWLARSTTSPQHLGGPAAGRAPVQLLGGRGRRGRDGRRPAVLSRPARAQLRLVTRSASAPPCLSPSGAGPNFYSKERFTMNQCEVGIRGLDEVMAFAGARWELLTFPEVRDLLRGAGRDRFVVLYEGNGPDIDGWCGLLTQAGFPAGPISALGDTGRTAS